MATTLTGGKKVYYLEHLAGLALFDDGVNLAGHAPQVLILPPLHEAAFGGEALHSIRVIHDVLLQPHPAQCNSLNIAHDLLIDE